MIELGSEESVRGVVDKSDGADIGLVGNVHQRSR